MPWNSVNEPCVLILFRTTNEVKLLQRCWGPEGDAFPSIVAGSERFPKWFIGPVLQRKQTYIAAELAPTLNIPWAKTQKEQLCLSAYFVTGNFYCLLYYKSRALLRCYSNISYQRRNFIGNADWIFQRRPSFRHAAEFNSTEEQIIPVSAQECNSSDLSPGRFERCMCTLGFD